MVSFWKSAFLVNGGGSADYERQAFVRRRDKKGKQSEMPREWEYSGASQNSMGSAFSSYPSAFDWQMQLNMLQPMQIPGGSASGMSPGEAAGMPNFGGAGGGGGLNSPQLNGSMLSGSMGGLSGPSDPPSSGAIGMPFGGDGGGMHGGMGGLGGNGMPLGDGGPGMGGGLGMGGGPGMRGGPGMGGGMRGFGGGGL
ncbi:hypothetical protein LTR91_010400 [Friedmanniomyces endolithicus]|uniref:Uncharacterized protein n=1 Tax=Friedmanniomyces endolithicus TaxID=329885 RepID=A0AAN6KJH0_9PEZI|nr:hypothetical protein LTR57_000478 [Friedmanniomyces endolithicus]KAK0985818.1 hypothetical protein LTR91_010400 [Friedmanniomyces endolithicus]KAK1005429.1 hypothetical protein LTS01_003331 [Friedmanniomyces endolithicus]KAK1048721.1 hypothetical protein LTS16_004194 [Friedmanniomyces endolithicus]